MKEYIPVLRRTRLFAGLSDEDISAILACLGSGLRNYGKGEYVLRQGEQIAELLVLVKGRLHIRNDDHWGNRSILAQLGEGEIFGAAFAAPDSAPLLNDVVAVEDSAVIFIDINRVISTCTNACRFHMQVVQNLFYAISERNRTLVRKLEHVTRRTTREKLISYLSEESKKQNSSYITIPFNRQQLADYLSVDRSALSNELCKMRDEGLLEFEKNRFRLR